MLEISTLTSSTKNASGLNFITANDNGDTDHDSASTIDADVHLKPASLWKKQSSGGTKSIFDPNISDSVLSIRNYSSILHTSSNNHTIFKLTSPREAANNLVRQTSTPMQHNIIVITSPDSLITSVSSSLHVSSINSSNSSESDISPGPSARNLK